MPAAPACPHCRTALRPLALSRRTDATEQPSRPWCCHIDPAGVGCNRDAEYEVWEQGTTRTRTPDGGTHSCAAHLAEMLTQAGEPLDPAAAPSWLVWPIGRLGEKSSG